MFNRYSLITVFILITSQISLRNALAERDSNRLGSLKCKGFESTELLCSLKWRSRRIPIRLSERAFGRRAAYIVKGVELPVALARSYRGYHRRAGKMAFTFNDSMGSFTIRLERRKRKPILSINLTEQNIRDLKNSMTIRVPVLISRAFRKLECGTQIENATAGEEIQQLLQQRMHLVIRSNLRCTVPSICFKSLDQTQLARCKACLTL